MTMPIADALADALAHGLPGPGCTHRKATGLRCGVATRGRPAAASLGRHRFEVRSHPQRRLLRVRTAQAGGDSARAPHRGQRPSALHRDHTLESRDLLESEGLPAAHQTTRQISW